jgi:quercetin dioxygenase-like cupin family protein
MRRLEPGRGRAIEQVDSAEAWVRGVSRRVLQVVLIEVGSGGVVGHPTGCHQVFAVLSGSGWVSGGDGARETITRGDVVIWEPGEEHESGSDEGMTAIVVEAEELDGLMDGAPTWSNVSLSDVAAGPCPVPGTGRGRGRPVRGRNCLDGGTGLSPAVKGQWSAPNTSRTCLKRAWRSSRLTVEADAPGV